MKGGGMSLRGLLVVAGVVLLCASLASATPTSSCTGDFTVGMGVCNFYESTDGEVIDLSLAVPHGIIGLGIIGIYDPDGVTLSDELNFYNNADGFVHATLYSDSKVIGGCCSGVTFEDATGFAVWNIGNVYNIYSNPTAPEPGTLMLFGTGLLGAMGAVRRRL